MGQGNDPYAATDRTINGLGGRVAEPARQPQDFLDAVLADWWQSTLADLPFPILPVILAVLGGGVMLLAATWLPTGSSGSRHGQPASDDNQQEATAPTTKARSDDKSPARLRVANVADGLERLGTCAVCMTSMDRTATGSCSHHFCVRCLLEVRRLSSRCPRCQTSVTAVRLDPEFDALLRLARERSPQGSSPAQGGDAAQGHGAAQGHSEEVEEVVQVVDDCRVL